jgi:hypothetical protein
MIITLPSDGGGIETNTPTDFSTPLPFRLTLAEGSLVGLRDFVIQHRWNNVTEKNNCFWYTSEGVDYEVANNKLSVLYSDDSEPTMLLDVSWPIPITFRLKKVELPVGQYDNPHNLISILNHLASRSGCKITFTYLDSLRRVYIKVPKDSILVWPEKDTGFGWLLGFKGRFYTGGDYRGDYELFQHKVIDSINVECDLIENQLVGETWRPVLRTIPLGAEKRDDTVVRRYAIPEYYPINKKEIDSIHIRICDAVSGRPIRLEGGKSILSLDVIKDS